VSRAAQREINVPAEEPVVGVHAVAGGVDVRQVGTHLPVHDDRAAPVHADAGRGGEGAVGSYARDDEHDVAAMVSVRGADPQPGTVGGDRANRGAVVDADAVVAEVFGEGRGQFGVDGGHDLVGEVAPVGYLAGDVVGDAADAVVRAGR
jgi:hypothetical protein